MPPKSTTQLLKQLRSLMQNPVYVPESINAYIVPSNDAHYSEYLAECDQLRAFISGFTGSDGTAIVTEKEALLWTDGRYFLQASQQLDPNWTLMKVGIPSTPTEGVWLSKNLAPNSKVGVDPKLYTHSMWTAMQRQLEGAGLKLVPVAQNLVSEIWSGRPKRPQNPILPLGIQFSGKSLHQKLMDIRAQMSEKKADILVITALDEVAWFLNLRGSDIEYNPVFFAYVAIHKDFFVVFLNPSQVTDEVRNHLKQEAAGNTFEIRDYAEIESYIKAQASRISEGFVWLSENSNFSLTSQVPSKHLLSETTPIALMKAVKNATEIAGMKNAHLKDGVALCCYFSWLEKNVASGKITEISGADKLAEFRAQQKDFVGLSFATINGVGHHGAIIHYHPEPETDIPITTDCLYLCDSGGQYKDGTTDVTRTFHFGTPTQYEKECFTRVLKGQVKLATSIFPTKIKGNYLDSFAREFLWEVGLDYAHGTGHGIGSYLNVHEGPIQISWRALYDDPGLEPGMFVSNEPGYYEDGKFGIRIEDIVLIVPAKTPHNFNDRGYLTFETVTFCPKQTSLIDVTMLTDKELNYINEYHKQCREVLGPLLEQQQQIEAKEWLWRQTEPLARN